MTQFPVYVNNTYATLATGGHTSGSGTLVLTAGQGAQFGSAFPFRVTVITAATYDSTAETLTIFAVTARTGDTLTVSVIEGSTDRNYAAGDVVEIRWTAGDATLISTAVNAIETAPYAVDGTVAHLAGTETISGAKTFSTLPVLGSLTGILKAATGVLSAATAGTDYLAPSGSGAALTGITESQVTGLVADLAAKATDTLVVHLAGTETITGAKTFSSVPTWPTQTANRIFAGPGTGVAAAPTFRALVAADLPIALPVTVANGGTGLATLTAHAVLLGEGASNVAFAAVGTAGRVLIDQGAAADPAFTAVSGDGTLSSAGALAVTKTGGVAFAASATTDTTNATNITSGTLPIARIAASALTYNKIQNEAVSSLLGNPTGSPAAPSEITLGPNLAFVGSTIRGRVPIATVLSPGTAVANSVALTSLFSGATLGGSLTIPANTFQVGSLLTLHLFGAFSSIASSNFFLKITLGGTLIAQGLPSQTMSAGTVTNFSWCFQYANLCGFLIQATGATGKIIGGLTFSPQAGTAQVMQAAGTTGAPASQVTIDTTASLTLDVLVQWGTASASNSFQLVGGAVFLDY